MNAVLRGDAESLAYLADEFETVTHTVVIETDAGELHIFAHDGGVALEAFDDE